MSNRPCAYCGDTKHPEGTACPCIPNGSSGARKKTVEEENLEAFETMFRLLNYMGNDTALAQVFSNRLPRQHRTLQQNFMRMMQTVIVAYAEQAEQNGSDLRNEDAVKWAKAVKAITESGMRFV